MNALSEQFKGFAFIQAVRKGLLSAVMGLTLTWLLAEMLDVSYAKDVEGSGWVLGVFNACVMMEVLFVLFKPLSAVLAGLLSVSRISRFVRWSVCEWGFGGQGAGCRWHGRGQPGAAL